MCIHLRDYPEKKEKDYGKCGIIRHHKVTKNKNGQFTCKYCGKTKFTLEKELEARAKDDPDSF